MTMLMFDAFKASAKRVEDIAAAVGLDDDQPVHGGFVYDGGPYIEDNSSVDPEFAAMGKYYLLIGRSDWVGDDLNYLAKILWADHYLFETVETVQLRDGDLDTFIQGYCAARRYTVDGDLFGVAFSGGDSFTPHEAAAIIDEAVRIYAAT